MHGDKDEVVPVSFLLEAIELFNRIDYKIQTKIFQNLISFIISNSCILRSSYP